MPHPTLISNDLMPTRDELEQIWQATTEAFHNAMPEGPVRSTDWTSEDTTRMRIAAGYAAYETVIKILNNHRV